MYCFTFQLISPSFSTSLVHSIINKYIIIYISERENYGIQLHGKDRLCSLSSIFLLLPAASESDRLIKNTFIPQFPINHLSGLSLSLSRACNKCRVAQVRRGFVFIYLPVHVVYSGLICRFDVLKRATGFSVARSPRWTPLKGAFSSFQHLGLLQIPRLVQF